MSNGRTNTLALTLCVGAGLLVGAGGTYLAVRRGPTAPASAEGKKPEAKPPDLPPGVVELSTEALRNAGLTTTAAQTASLPITLDVTGTVSPVESRVAHVRPLGQGVIESVSVSLGAKVEKGQVLLAYDNSDLGQQVGGYLSARAELRQAEADLKLKQKALDRAQELIKLEAVAQQTLEQRRAELESALAVVANQQASVSRIEEQLHRFGLTDADLTRLGPDTSGGSHRIASHNVLRAPLAGIVTKSDAAAGEVVRPDEELFTIADLTTVWVLADVYERDIAKVRVGTDAVVRVEAYPDRVFTGRVTYVSALIDPKTRTAKVRCVVPNTDGTLKLDMFARISIPTAGQRNALAVPVSAVQQIDNQPVVFVREALTRFRRQAVKTGATAGDQVEILSGLKPGDTVAASGSFYLKTALLRERIAGE